LEVRFIDLFSGIGGFRGGFERACSEQGFRANCVFSSEIKERAVEVYKTNFGTNFVHGDITQIASDDIPEFDVLLGGFPCQAFSTAGKRKGFDDTRGTLFFEIQRILEHHQPRAFILENVEGLVTHDRENTKEKIGKTLRVILNNLRAMDYEVTWKVLNSLDFGVPQSRRRIFIVGAKRSKVSLSEFPEISKPLGEILEKDVESEPLNISEKLMKMFSPEELYGKAIKDRRGGENNIHSWQIGLKGRVSKRQEKVLDKILRARRNKKWAEQKGIAWSDGMPLTLEEIKSFCNYSALEKDLEDLVTKGYLVMNHPKDFVHEKNGDIIKRVKRPRKDLPKGYNIVTGKLSFEISNILDPGGFTPTLVATDIYKLAVLDGKNLRRLTKTELARLFGFDDDFQMNVKINTAYDLYGNSIVIPVAQAISERLLQSEFLGKDLDFPIDDDQETFQLGLF